MSKAAKWLMQRFSRIQVAPDSATTFLLLNSVIVGNVMGAVAALGKAADSMAILSLSGMAAACLALAFMNRSVGRFATMAACIWSGFALTFTDFYHIRSTDVWAVVAIWWAFTALTGGAIVEFRNFRRRQRIGKRAHDRAALAQAIAVAAQFAPQASGPRAVVSALSV